MSDDLRARAEQWMKDDPDPVTREELRGLLAQPDLAKTDVADRFAGTLEFGTAGLRGVIGAGPNRMNRAVVWRTALGLARYLLQNEPSVKTRGIVIGYDGRRLSRELAEDSAAIFAAAGVPSFLATTTVPTPLTAFAIAKTGAAAGVMVTASHNPPEYNGYKVYWSNAAQIIPPVDEGIARAIVSAPPAREVPMLPLAAARKEGLVKDLGEEVSRAYLDAVRALAVHAKDGDRAMPIVYTPMHGVGDALARRAFAEAGFTNVTSVPEQQKPDAAFPTVAFPNPEEPGAMDLSFALARKLGAALVLANDPDADRLAVAIPHEASKTGYLQLTGNQVGVLLGHYLLTERAAAPGKKRLVLASIVSSPLLGHIAKLLDVRYEETLTGFKWIANRAMELERAESVDFVFGYEEALGYTVGDVVRDKDGISAAALAAEMVAVLRARGRTVHDEIESIHRRYGLFVSSQVNLVRKGASGTEEIRAMMDRLRAARPAQIGAYPVEAVLDYDARTRRTKDGQTSPLTLPRSNVLSYELAGGSRIIARPSGTEPKIKFYFDVRETIAQGEPLETAEARANTAMKALSDAFVRLAG